MDADLYEKLLTDKAEASTFEKKKIETMHASSDDFSKSF